MITRYLLAVMLLPGSLLGSEAPVVLENERLLVEFSPTDGSITRLTNKAASLELLSVVPASPSPWMLLLAPGEFVSKFHTFHIASSATRDAQTVQLRWETTHQIVITAEARLAMGSDELELRCSAENVGDRTILALRYPALQGIGTLSVDGGQDRLLHSTMMGALFYDPWHLFRGDAVSPAGRGMVVSRYPNGFHGSALQLMAYYVEDRGGFYIASHDSHLNDKDLNFYKAADDRSLVCEIAHIQPDARAGKSLVVEYPVVIAALTQGTWYEAAERYRGWAVHQPWCRRGTQRLRIAAGDGCSWLREEMGAVGMWWPFRDDIRDAITGTRQLFAAPLLHLELWWRNAPAREMAQQNGERFGPFYFPFLALQGQREFSAHGGDAIVPRTNSVAPDWVAMCPTQPGWRNVICESAEDLAGSLALRHHQIWVDENQTGCQADCLYYDIGPCAGVPTHCYALNHAHTPGAGHDITRAYISLFEESQRRASQVRGAYVPVGTECVSEPFVGCLDLYYARNAGLSLDMETFPYVRDLSWLPDGRMDIVPLFPFVYHEYGPVAVQGIYSAYPWGLSEAEDYCTWAEARSVLWGGLVVTFPLTDRAVLSDQRVHFLRSLAAARTGFAREFLAYGRMQRPPQVPCGNMAINHGLSAGGWLQKIRGAGVEATLGTSLAITNDPVDGEQSSPALSVEQWAASMLAVPITPAQTQALRVPTVLCQAYTLSDDQLGILFVNLRRDAEERVQVPFDPRRYGLAEGTYEFTRSSLAGQQRTGVYPGDRVMELALPPRDVVLWTAVRVGD